MNKLKLKLKNCYGISNLDYEIDFTKKNVSIIYAPNGTMKSSLAKIFKSLNTGETIEDRIFGLPATCDIKDENGDVLDYNNIIVVNPYDEEKCEEQGKLIANDALRKKYISIHQSIEDKKNTLFKEIRETFAISSREKTDIEFLFLKDWGLTKKNEYEGLISILSELYDSKYLFIIEPKDLKYKEIFNKSGCDILESGTASKELNDYEKLYTDLISKSKYMSKGVIDHNNFREISKCLDTNNYFKAKNELKLVANDGSGSVDVKSVDELNRLIEEEKNKILNTPELNELFNSINSKLQANKDSRTFGKFIENNQDIINEYTDIDLFKKKIWIRAFKEHENDLKDLVDEYNKAKVELSNLSKDANNEITEWKNALELFKTRFFVPFDIEIDNQDDVILNESLPVFKFNYTDKNGNKQQVEENVLTKVLSTGEKRAYYILNFLFKIQIALKNNNQYLLILDDICDSFDYKNKYAIIEYIDDIAEENNKFNILLLTHNFDFYRTISTRVIDNKNKENVLMAYTDVSGNVKIEQNEKYNNDFFHSSLRGGISNNCMLIASIPFVRNIILYREGSKHADYIKLTSLLHFKTDTKSITFKELENLYNRQWFTCNISTKREKDSVYDLIITEANKISDVENIDIVNKLILTMAIRLKTEEFMINEIKDKVSSGEVIINSIYAKAKAQTGLLINEYKKNFSDQNVIKLLDQVSMMTPENIHLNSFMYEPILDMSIHELYKLYQDVKKL